MNRPAAVPLLDREKVRQFGALGYLLLLGGLALAGPYGFVAWGENLALLDKREAQIKQLEHERKLRVASNVKKWAAKLEKQYPLADFSAIDATTPSGKRSIRHSTPRLTSSTSPGAICGNEHANSDTTADFST